MPRPRSRIAPDSWDYTTLDPEIIRDAAALTEQDLLALARPGSSTNWASTSVMRTSGAWTNGSKTAARCP
jgi:hypothetical protein